MTPVRVGVLGCARIARSAILEPARQSADIVVSAIGSRDAARAAAFAEAHGVARSHGSYEALIDDPEIEVVYNPLPNSLHAEWSIKALRAGKAVLCEKPLASNAAEAQSIVDAARESGAPLIEAFHYRYHPVADFIVRTVRSGILGRLTRMRAAMKVSAGLVAPGDIRFQADLAGGSAMALGAYGVNIMRLVAGGEPEVIEAAADEVSPGVDGAMTARLRFEDGLVGELECALSAPAFEAAFSLEGEAGRLEVANPFLPQLGHRAVLEAGGESRTERFDKTATYVFQARHVVEVVRHGAAVRTPGEDGVANMAVIDALYRAAGLRPRGSHSQ
ncbi:MAG: Gfo/Idh/MocA family oxidoreductase [Caulobacteraceae bacterium]|nr:Gfo/Idh/MocA family oxidoreductase [Caulobacteraceae bacterium]